MNCIQFCAKGSQLLNPCGTDGRTDGRTDMERIRNEARWRILWRRSILSILENIVQTFNLEHIGAFCADACNVKNDYFASIIFLMPG